MRSLTQLQTPARLLVLGLALIGQVMRAYGQTEKEFLVFQSPCAAQQETSGPCALRNIALLGGIFPLHSWTMDASLPLGGTCTGTLRQAGFQRTEAMRFAIDQINAAGVVPGVTFQFEIRDSCISPDLTRLHTLRFINRGIGTGDHCNISRGQPVSGVVGASASGASIAAADLLGLFKVPQISYASTSATLSNKDRYRYFLRTLPPDNFQAQAMTALVRALNASFISLIHSTGSYGTDGAAEIRSAVSALPTNEDGTDTCIAVDRNVGRNNNDVPSSLYNSVLKDLVGGVGQKANVAVAFSGSVTMDGLLQEAVRSRPHLNLSDHHLWIASDSWSTSSIVATSETLEAARGLLGVTPVTGIVDGFEKHFRSLHPNHNKAPSFNPWLSEFWETVFNCDPDSQDDQERLSCRQKSLQNSSYSFQQEAFVPFVIDAVYSFAYAIQKLQAQKCGESFRGLCPAMLSAETARLGAIDGTSLLTLLLNSNFQSSAGHTVAFTSNGDLSTASYVITNLQVDHMSAAGKYKNVGSWQRLVPATHVGPSSQITDGVLTMIHCLPDDTPSQVNCTPAQLRLNLSAIQWRDGTFGVQSIPRSRCSEPCQSGHYAKPMDNTPETFRHCCWMCERCGDSYYTTAQFEACQRCPDRQRGNTNRTGCVDLSEEHWNIAYVEAIVCTVLSIGGIVTTVAMVIAGVSVKHLLHKHSALSIKPLLHCLVGSLGLFCFSFLVMAEPTPAICLVSDVWVSLFMSCLLSPFLIELLLVIRESRQQEQEEQTSRKAAGENDSPGTDIVHLRQAGVLEGVILGVTIIVLALATAANTMDIEVKVDANVRVEIGCQTEQRFFAGIACSLVVASVCIGARLYCLTHDIPVHTTLSRAAYIMVIAVIIVGAGYGIMVILSPTSKGTMKSFVAIVVAFAFVNIVLIPDLFLTLAPPVQHTSSVLGRRFLSSLNRMSRKNSVLEAFRTAATTLQEKSLFNATVRKQRKSIDHLTVAAPLRGGLDQANSAETSLSVTPQPTAVPRHTDSSDVRLTSYTKAPPTTTEVEV